MTLPWTVASLIVGVLLTLFCRWHQTRPRGLGEVSLVPSTLLLTVALLLVVLSAAHLVSLLSGVPLHGRLMPRLG